MIVNEGGKTGVVHFLLSLRWESTESDYLNPKSACQSVLLLEIIFHGHFMSFFFRFVSTKTYLIGIYSPYSLSLDPENLSRSTCRSMNVWECPWREQTTTTHNLYHTFWIYIFCHGYMHFVLSRYVCVGYCLMMICLEDSVFLSMLFLSRVGEMREKMKVKMVWDDDVSSSRSRKLDSLLSPLKISLQSSSPSHCYERDFSLLLSRQVVWENFKNRYRSLLRFPFLALFPFVVLLIIAILLLFVNDVYLILTSCHSYFLGLPRQKYTYVGGGRYLTQEWNDKRDDLLSQEMRWEQCTCLLL